MIRINIAFKLAKSVEKSILSLSKELSQYTSSYFILNSINCFPHITIYAPVIAEKKLDEVFLNFRLALEELPIPVFKFINITTGQGYISANFSLTKTIKEIQQSMTQKICIFREKDLNEIYKDGRDYNMKFSHHQLKNLTKYGYSGASPYNPHLTLIRYKNEKQAEGIVPKIQWNIDDFTIDTLALFEMGENGICRRLIKELKLRQ